MPVAGVNFTMDICSRLIFLGGVSTIIGWILGLTGLACGCIVSFTLFIGSSIAYLFWVSLKVPSDGKAVLITGCDSGFGHALALHLHTLGFRVFACCLFADKNGEGAESLRKLGSDKMHVIQLDVTSETSAGAAKEQVQKLLPQEDCLWGVVNNAGMGVFGDLEWVPLATYKRMADVNIFGGVIVTKTFLPLLKKAKGRIVNVSSMLGRFAVPMRSPYVMTKYAVEGLSDCIRHELKPWGVKVIILEPGNFIAGTNIFTAESVEKQGEDLWKSMTEETRKEYGEDFFRSRVELMKSYVTCGDTDISPVIYAFEEALTQKYPQKRYVPADLYYWTRLFLATHLPEFVYDMIYVGCLYK